MAVAGGALAQEGSLHSERPANNPPRTPAFTSIEISPVTQANPRLERLFTALKNAQNQPSAERIARTIEQVWQTDTSPLEGVLLERAEQALESHDISLAHDLAAQILEHKPSSFLAWNLQARIHYTQGEYDLAFNAISHVLEHEPRHFRALAGLGLVLRELEQKPGAIKALEMALEIHPFLSEEREILERLRLQIQRDL